MKLALPCLFAALLAVACGDDDDDGVTPTIDASVPPGIDASTECPNPVPAPTECDFFLSCGCNTATQKCSIQSDMRNCFPFGAKAVGEACAQDNECVPGSLCASQDDGSTTCMKFCDSAHACPDGTACYVGVDSSVEATLCGQVCDLLTQDCALDNQGCYGSSTLDVDGKGICVAAGAGAEAADCTKANDCAEGLTCIMMDQKCHKLCDREGGAPTCGDGQTCEPINGQDQVGYCLTGP